MLLLCSNALWIVTFDICLWLSVLWCTLHICSFSVCPLLFAACVCSKCMRIKLRIEFFPIIPSRLHPFQFVRYVWVCRSCSVSRVVVAVAPERLQEINRAEKKLDRQKVLLVSNNIMVSAMLYSSVWLLCIACSGVCMQSVTRCGNVKLTRTVELEQRRKNQAPTTAPELMHELWKGAKRQREINDVSTEW